MKWTWLLVGAAFGLGGAVGRSSSGKALPLPGVHVEPAAAAGACVDPLAMNANARLVDEVRDADQKARLADERARSAETKVTHVTTAPPARLVPGQAEWARMARENVITLRRPCATWDATQHVGYRTENGMRMRGAGSLSRQADLFRMPEEDRETLAGAYKRAHARTWAAMKAYCEPPPPEDDDDGAQKEEPTDADRINACAYTASSDHGAVHDVAVLRGRGVDAASTDGKLRALAAFTESSQVLFEELTKSFGREQATVLVDRGLVCVDETTFDLRPASDG